MFSMLRQILFRLRRLHPALLAGIVVVVALAAFGITHGPAGVGPTVARAAANKAPSDLSYSALAADMKARTIKSATIKPARYKVEVVLKDGSRRNVGYSPSDDSLAQRLTDAGAQVTVDTSFTRGGFPWSALVLVFSLVGVFFAMLFLQRQQAKAAGGKQGAKKASKAGVLPNVRFADVAGCDEAVMEAAELVEFLKRPGAYKRLGAKMPAGLMLYGPPGTGKTLLAKAVAGEAGAAFFAVSGSDFVEMYVGVGAARVRDLFATAREQAPAIIFIDEVDALGGKRASGPEGQGNREADQTLNQLLVEMDGFTGNDQVLVIAATNRLDTLDPALLRPGRFSRHIHVSAPSEEGRLAILGVHAQGKPLADDVDLPHLAKVTAGSSGAELAEMLNEGAIMAARGGRDEIPTRTSSKASCASSPGRARRRRCLPRASARPSPTTRPATCCAPSCARRPTRPCTRRSTRAARPPGSPSSGRSDRALHTAQHIHEQLIYILGGRAAEHVVNGMVSSGAANDLEKANAIARAAVEQYGLSAAVGQVVATQSGLADSTRATVDSEVRRIVEEAYREAIRMVQEHRAQLERLAQALLTAGDIDHLEIAAAMEGSVIEPRRPNLQPLPEPEPEFQAGFAEPASGRLWVPGREGAGAAIAAFRSSRGRTLA